MKKHFKVLCSDRLVLMLTTRAKFAQETDVALRQRPFWMRIMGPKNSCAEMSQNFRWQKTIVLIVIYILELVLS